jgi:hypothetical protein
MWGKMWGRNGTYPVFSYTWALETGERPRVPGKHKKISQGLGTHPRSLVHPLDSPLEG